MGYQKEVILLGANSYNFKDETSGRIVSGTSLHVVDMSDVSEYGVGFVPSKVTATEELFQSLVGLELPAFAELTIEPSLKKNKAPKVLGIKVLEKIGV